jgi:2-dehydro-3-deoxyglucarate aldolase
MSILLVREMIKNKDISLKRILCSKSLTIGSWITLGHPAIGEIMSSCGFDWLTIDMEHSALTFSDAQNLIQVIELAGCIPLVRVGCNDPTIIKRVMDSGSHGVIVPQVNCRADAVNAVKAVKYPPFGNRGVGLGRAQGYGMSFEEYKKWENQETVVIVQIEHIDAVNNIDDILSVEGVDGFIVGPYDLSASLGVPGQFEHPSFLKAMGIVNDYISNSSKVVAGFHVVHPDPDMVKRKNQEGYSLIAYSLDSLLLGNSCSQDLQTILGDKWTPLPYVKEKFS